MPPTLRPMKLGEILDQGFSIYRRNFWQLAGVALIPAMIIFSLRVVDLTWVHLNQIGHPKDSGSIMAVAYLVALIYLHINSFIFLLFYPAFARTSSAILFGESFSIAGSLRFAAKRWRTYLLIGFLVILAETLIPEGLGFGFMAGCGALIDRFSLNDYNVLIAFVVGVPVFGVAVLIGWIGAGLSFAAPTAALEQMPGFKALRRSWRLSKGSRGRVAVSWVAINLLLALLWTVVQSLTYLSERSLAAAKHVHLTQKFYMVSRYSLGTIYDALLGPLFPVILILLYYDQRVRKEGYDIERMIDAAGLTVSMSTASGAVAPEPAAVQAVSAPPEGASVQPAGEGLA